MVRHTIYTESNPNPQSLKFVSNNLLIGEGETYDFPSVESAENSPLATSLFNEFPFVRRVFLMSNFITITKDENTDWSEVQNTLRNYIAEYLDEGKSLIEGDIVQENSAPSEEVSMMDVKIRQILDEYVKPAVEQDGGAISFVSFQEGVVKVQLQGACSGCPSSTVTLKAGIENLLKTMVPEVESVEAEGV